MAGKKGNTADPALHSSKSSEKNGDELKNKIEDNEKYIGIFDSIDVDSDYDDILADYEETLDKRTRAAMMKVGGEASGEEVSADMIEADEIISDKLEEQEPEVQPSITDENDKKAKRKEVSQKAAQSAYEYITLLGLAVGGGVRRVLNKPKKLWHTACNFFVFVFRFLWLGLKKFVHLITHTFVEQVKDFRKDVHKAWRYLKRSIRHPKTFVSIFRHYVSKAFKTHTQLFKTVANFGLPVLAVIAFIITVNYWSSVTFALKVSYDNKELGYISDESVYNEAKTAAQARMVSTDVTSAKLVEPKYELSLVSVNKLVNSDILCDRIIENSESNVTNACGIFIDDEFLCSVKNETDATSVFNAILEKHKVTDENSFVDFVEKVEYVQGLYPDESSTMWDASKLKAKLNETKQAKKYYTVKDGDTIYGIAIANGLTEKQLIALNPDIGDNIYTGDKLVISNEVNYVRVKVMKTETRKVEVAYDIEKTNDASLFKGTSRVTRKGIKGEDTVTELVTYIDGQRVSSQEISRVRTKEPVTEKVKVGTRSTKVNGSGGYNISVSARGFVWPAPACTFISSPYGWRILYGRSDFHTGIDLTLPGGGSTGAIIVASLDGTVESVRRGNTGYGHCIVINHGGGVKTRYAHCLAGSISVSVGQRVSAGQAIARVGRTGYATGPHLHFEIIINGSTVNPLPYLR